MNTALCAAMLTRALNHFSMCVYVAGNLVWCSGNGVCINSYCTVTSGPVARSQTLWIHVDILWSSVHMCTRQSTLAPFQTYKTKCTRKLACETKSPQMIRFIMWRWCVVRCENTPLGQLITFRKEMSILSTAMYMHYRDYARTVKQI